MKATGLLALASGASAFLAPRAATKSPYEELEGAEPVVNDYLVTLHENHTLEDHFANIGVNVANISARFHHMDNLNVYSFSPQSQTSDFVHDVIRHDPGVKYVRPNYYVRPEFPKNSRGPMAKRQPRRTMSSRIEKRQLGSGAIEYEASWNLAMITKGWVTGDPEQDGPQRLDLGEKMEEKHFALKRSYPGAGVNIYVFDSGVNERHNEFNGYRGEAPKVRHFGGLGPGDKSPYCIDGALMDDDEGHGTHVAAIAAGMEVGVAPAAHIVNVKKYCKTTTQLTLKSINDVIAEHKKFLENPPFIGWRGSVINISMDFQLDTRDLGVQDALEMAAKLGIPIAAAAGNRNEADIKLPAKFKSVIGVGAVNSDYERWQGRHTAGSSYSKKIDMFAPGASILSADYSCEDCYVVKSGTSGASPHVAGAMAIMVDYEGTENIGHAKNVYSRLKENALALVHKDAHMLKEGTTDLLLQTGINYVDEHPYRGVPADAEIPSPNSPWGPHTWMRDGDHAPKPVAPRPKKVMDAPEEWGMKGKVLAPAEPDSLDCLGLESGKYVTRNSMVDTIDEFCESAAAEKRPAKGSKFISKLYNKGTPNMVNLMVGYDSPDMDVEVTKEPCVYYLKDLILDRCDASKTGNPDNHKGGGLAKTGRIMFFMIPVGERDDEEDEGDATAECSVDTQYWGPKQVHTQIRIEGSGWAKSDKAQELIKEAEACGVATGDESTMFDDAKDGKWTLEMEGATDIEETCIAEAIKKSGGPKVTCKKTNKTNQS